MSSITSKSADRQTDSACSDGYSNWLGGFFNRTIFCDVIEIRLFAGSPTPQKRSRAVTDVSRPSLRSRSPCVRIVRPV